MTDTGSVDDDIKAEATPKTGSSPKSEATGNDNDGGSWHGFAGDVKSTITFDPFDTPQLEVMAKNTFVEADGSPFTSGGESAISSGGGSFGQP